MGIKQNIGRAERIIRIVISLIFLISGVVFDSIYGIVGLILIGTAFLGWCPLYRLLRIKTIKEKKAA